MKRFRRGMGVAVVLALAVCLCSGCATLGLVDDVPSYLETQYKGLTVAQETYNTIWGGFKMLYDTGATDDEGDLIVDQKAYDNGYKAAKAYYDAWQLWMDTVINYEVGATGQETVEEKAKAFLDISTEFINLLAPYINN